MSSGPSTSQGWDLVVSYGDLSRPSGYRTRVLGELENLDSHSGLNPYLLLFDRNPEEFERTAPPGNNIPFRAHHRSAMIRFYPEIARLARLAPIRVIHAHNLYSAALALSARRLHGYKVILDYHGRVPEEYVYLGKGGDASRKALERLERWAVRQSDHVVVVSNKLADYLKDAYGIASEKLSVIPCCTDPAAFRWFPALRHSTRERLDMTHKLVCTHLGSFFEWYDPESLLRIFTAIRSQLDNAHLLVITAEADEARTYLGNHLSPGTFTVTTATSREIPSLLNASDLGFLLLKPSPNIQASSPVKFAEYLSCGLPVVITADVGDYSDCVQQTRTGWITDPARPIDTEFLFSILTDREAIAERCLTAAQTLTWPAMQDQWARTIRALLNLG